VRARNSLARTPPMGWMSWELFRCDVDCVDSPDMCISEKLYRAQTDALVDGGYLKAGYEGIHLDDCWEEKYPPRDKNTGMLQPNASRFPSGMKSLGDYMHNKKVKFGLYTAESPSTCGGYPASAPYHEKLDAKTFASWGVDYLKVDGCGPTEYYKGGYKAMGEALEESGRNIVYSCSWPAYINNGNETLQPFGEFINDGCNLWRNWHDIQCNWDSLGSIIDHWGDYGPSLVPFAGPGHWHDMDQLLVGAHCVTEEEERTNMAIWCISATPLIMGNDLRNVSAASKAILLNTDAIAVNQDPLGQMGMRLTKTAVEPAQVWYRNLANGDVAVALYNKDNGAPIEPPFDNSTANCEAKDTWIETEGGYYEACGGSEGDIGSFTRKTLAEAKTSCCANKDCAGFSFDKNGDGFFKKNANCGMTKSSAYTGYTRASAIPSQPTPNARDITVKFADLHLYGPVEVYDIWAQKMVGTFTDGSYTAKEVAHHDTAFLRLSSGAEDDNN
jgi:alpha-N-acetylgalactosaminidase